MLKTVHCFFLMHGKLASISLVLFWSNGNCVLRRILYFLKATKLKSLTAYLEAIITMLLVNTLYCCSIGKKCSVRVAFHVLNISKKTATIDDISIKFNREHRFWQPLRCDPVTTTPPPLGFLWNYKTPPPPSEPMIIISTFSIRTIVKTSSLFCGRVKVILVEIRSLNLSHSRKSVLITAFRKKNFWKCSFLSVLVASLYHLNGWKNLLIFRVPKHFCRPNNMPSNWFFPSFTFKPKFNSTWGSTQILTMDGKIFTYFEFRGSYLNLSTKNFIRALD